MKIADKPKNEIKRLEVLQSLGLLNTPSEERFDRLQDSRNVCSTCRSLL